MLPEVHHPVKCSCPSGKECLGCTRYSPKGRTRHPQQRSNYEPFNRNNSNIHHWSWNYRGCWHQTCPPIDSKHDICWSFIPSTKHGCLVLLFLVTTSLCWDWAICAPAAFLRCGSHLSGSLSGVKPSSSVTCHSHSRPLPCRRKLIGQKLSRRSTSETS